MRIAELSARTGVSVPTIKYYLREGILPAGELSSPNQADYGVSHVQRLRMVRALVDIGRLPIATIRVVLEHLDQPDPNLHNVLGKALHDTMTTRAEVDAPAREEIEALVKRRGWRIGAGAPAADVAAEVMAALRQLGEGGLLDLLDDYAAAVERIAAADLTYVQRLSGPEAIVRGAVIGTILGDTLLAALRRLAQENESGRRFDRPPG
jgi:DNA-binding transcriptional MerR regulator